MITIPGTLSVRSLNGRFGQFNVGKLRTSIGEFSVKDASLEQLKEGKYTGNFVIDQIKPSSYLYEGRFTVEVRAYLESMLLDEKDELSHEEAASLEGKTVDPLEQEQAESVKPEVQPAPAEDEMPFGMEPHELKSKAASQKPTTASTGSDDEKLFGILWPIGEEVKLDATVDRQVLRLQTQRLGQLGYELNFKTQTWSNVPNF